MTDDVRAAMEVLENRYGLNGKGGQEAALWRVRYETLKDAVRAVCAAAEAGDRTMGGRECLDLITVAVNAIEERRVTTPDPVGPPSPRP